jgi:hypothetical protein
MSNIPQARERLKALLPDLPKPVRRKILTIISETMVRIRRPKYPKKKAVKS